MLRAATLSWLLLALLGLALPLAGAQGQERRSVLDGVAALAKPVTYSETRIALGDLVRKVAGDTGAPLTPTKEVADEPVAIAVKNLPARELLEQLADLLDYQWRREGREGAWRYEIGRDLASKQREEALRRAATGDREARLQEAVKRIVEMASLPQAEIDALNEKGRQRLRELQELPEAQRQAIQNSPEERARLEFTANARQLWSPINRALAKLLGRLPQEHWALLRQGEPLTLSSAPGAGELPLPPDMLRTFRDTEFHFRRPGVVIPPQYAEQVARRERQGREQWTGASGYQVLAWLDRGEAYSGLDLRINAHPLRDREPIPDFRVGDVGYLHIQGSTYAQRLQQLAEERTPERAEALAADPVLGATKPFLPAPAVRAQGWYAKILDYLPEVARTYNVPIISDAYAASVLVRPVSSPEPTALWALLDRLSSSHHSWERRGRVVRMRHRTWFLERPREVPLRLVRRWEERFEQHGALRWEDVVEARKTLKDAQRWSLGELFLERYGFPVDFGANGDRSAPLLFEAFTTVQRRRLRLGRPLPMADMTPAQRHLFLGPLRFIMRYNLRSRLPPVSIRDWTRASFSLKSERLLRTRERQNGSVRYRDQPAPPPGTAPAREAVPMARAPRPGAGAPAASAQEATRRYLVTRLRFQFQYTPGLRRSEDITVVSAP